ncbi:MAG: hypothetical protein WBW33_10585 [Bryobacteraceae bacterium]
MSDLARRRTLFFLGLFAALLASRLCHLHILWAEEGYGSAGAVQILHGKMIYRDFWFDKPPLAALLYVLWGGSAGWALRLAGSLFGLLTAFAAWRCASALWSQREGYWAAGLVTFFLIFDMPAAVMTLGPDLIVVPLAFAAVGFVSRNQPVWAGVWCAVAVHSNAKALLLVAVVMIWGGRRQAWKIAAASVGGVVIGLAGLIITGSLRAYWTQVWEFGSLYSRDTFVQDPLREGVVRSLNWLGFHLALVIPAAIALIKDKGTTRWRFGFWLCLATAGVVAGERYFPRYYLILVPPVTLLAARGFVLLSGWYRKADAVQSGTSEEATSLARVAPTLGPQWRCVFCVCLGLLLIPLIRFGPRYGGLAVDLLAGRPHHWADVALNQDSQEVASEISEFIRSRGISDPSLLVWGYRPDLFAYTQLPAGTPYLDSQMLTGVIADRHLTNTKVSLPGAAQNRLALAESRPTFIVDGLGVLNPRLAITEYPELHSWLSENYEEVGRTKDSVVFVRRDR